ncbi:Transferase [Corchorus olitorius]|uniref:Transferase n=1 Tax=Corchorus olitorius TaxID=93759 RepID=A0A1R3IG11_9ROSI|nr:Transferase [Corchorus olitorius]
MDLEVEVVSREIVQPSSPTPDRLRSYQFSFLDQVAHPIYNPLVMFYQKICDTEANKIKISNQLKHSISKALTYFYPLAGRMTSDHLSINCNDEGILFLEARVKCQLSDVINNPIPSELNKLLPFSLYHDCEEFQMGIQFNIFECGGIAVGLCITHKIGDALSLFTFVNLWAAIARGDKKLVVPQFGLASLFPPRDLSGFINTIPKPKEKLVNKRQMRESIKELDKEYVKKIQDGYNYMQHVREIAAGKRETVPFCFTSLCRFPIYEADFGWGKPIWVASAARDMMNLVAFMDTADGKGIEAWVCLKEEDMAKFESDEEIVASIASKSF